MKDKEGIVKTLEYTIKISQGQSSSKIWVFWWEKFQNFYIPLEPMTIYLKNEKLCS